MKKAGKGEEEIGKGRKRNAEGKERRGDHTDGFETSRHSRYLFFGKNFEFFLIKTLLCALGRVERKM